MNIRSEVQFICNVRERLCVQNQVERTQEKAFTVVVSGKRLK